MALFVHFAAEKDIAAIKRVGLRFPKQRDGVYAMPVLPNFYVSHQWMRELKRGGQRTFLAVYFRIPDDEPVLVGRYNKPVITVSAAQAAAVVAQTGEGLGMQVIVPRPITPKEIRRVRHLPKTIGWRYQPDAHHLFDGYQPFNWPGTINSTRRLRRFAVIASKRRRAR